MAKLSISLTNPGCLTGSHSIPLAKFPLSFVVTDSSPLERPKHFLATASSSLVNFCSSPHSNPHFFCLLIPLFPGRTEEREREDVEDQVKEHKEHEKKKERKNNAGRLDHRSRRPKCDLTDTSIVVLAVRARHKDTHTDTYTHIHIMNSVLVGPVEHKIHRSPVTVSVTRSK